MNKTERHLAQLAKRKRGLKFKVRNEKKKLQMPNKSECYKVMLKNLFFTMIENFKELVELLDSSKSTHLNPEEINNLIIPKIRCNQ